MKLEVAKDYIVFPFKSIRQTRKGPEPQKRNMFRMEWDRNLVDMRHIKGFNGFHVLMKPELQELGEIGDGDVVVLAHGLYEYDKLMKDTPAKEKALTMAALAERLAHTLPPKDEKQRKDFTAEVCLPTGYSGKIILWACSSAGESGTAKELQRELQSGGYKCPVWGCKWVTASITKNGVFRCCRGWLAGTEDPKEAEQKYPSVDCTRADMVQYGGDAG